MIRTLAWIALTSDIALLSLNLAGIAIGLRNPSEAKDLAGWYRRSL